MINSYSYYLPNIDYIFAIKILYTTKIAYTIFSARIGEKGVDLAEQHDILLTAKYRVSPPHLLCEPPKVARMHVFQK